MFCSMSSKMLILCPKILKNHKIPLYHFGFFRKCALRFGLYSYNSGYNKYFPIIIILGITGRNSAGHTITKEPNCWVIPSKRFGGIFATIFIRFHGNSRDYYLLIGDERSCFECFFEQKYILAGKCALPPHWRQRVWGPKPNQKVGPLVRSLKSTVISKTCISDYRAWINWFLV